jgi:tetratricopeptide (TPR) repeat protein
MIFARIFVFSGLLIAAFAPARAAAAAGMGLDGGMSKADVRAKADAAFDQLKMEKADTPFEKNLVDNAKAKFDKFFEMRSQAWGDKPISSKNVDDIGATLDTVMAGMDQYIDIIQNPSLGRVEKQKELVELAAQFDRRRPDGDGDHQDHNPGGDGGSGGVIDAPIDLIAKNALAQAAISASEQLIDPHDRGSFPSPGKIFGGAGGAPQDPLSAITAADDLIFKGDLSGALAMADKAVELGGGPDALELRGGIQSDLGNYSKAGADGQAALALRPGDKDALALVHFSEGRADGLQSAASDGAVGGSGPLSGPLGLSAAAPSGAAPSGMSSEQAQKAGRSALDLNDLGGAMAFVNRALARDPRNPALLNLRSSIDARRRDYALAVEDAKAGLALDPKNAALLRSLGFAQLRDKDYKGALATANETLELNPNDAYAYALRAHAYGSMGDRDAMIADLRRAAELDPRFAQAAAQMASRLQLPEDKDALFLFPGEEPTADAKTSVPAVGRGRRFALLVGASVLGGLMLALAILVPLKERLASALTQITRTGPAVTAAAADEDAALPPIRGQYEISRQIGAGGMGTVFAGTDLSLGRPVAIKRMREELRDDPREKARFVAEAKTVAALHHPNIVDIYAIAEDGGDLFLVFEYVDGRTVDDLVRSGGKLEPERAARIVRASADALEYSHSRGVIHRDMKPSNVMLDESGRVKVMDFGIARAAKDAMTRFSMTNAVIGTPPYMAPEQEEGQVRRESDVYALAVCAYEMLTGKLPFVGSGAGMLLNKINMSYVAPSCAIAGLPEPLDEVFAKAFQPDPDKRYRTPKEFADALESALPSAARS